MRLDRMEAWRSRAGFAICIGVLVALPLAGYALLQLIGAGIASGACYDGGGCERHLDDINSHYEAVLGFALLGTVGLVAWLSSVRSSLARRIEELRLRPELPIATVTSDRERAAGHPG